MVKAIANIEVTLKIDEAEVVLKEGSKVADLVYKDRAGKEQTIESGVVDRIDVYRNQYAPVDELRDIKVLGTEKCPPKFSDVCVPTRLVIDTSKAFEAKHEIVDVINIVSVGSVE